MQDLIHNLIIAELAIDMNVNYLGHVYTRISFAVTVLNQCPNKRGILLHQFKLPYYLPTQSFVQFSFLTLCSPICPNIKQIPTMSPNPIQASVLYVRNRQRKNTFVSIYY